MGSIEGAQRQHRRLYNVGLQYTASRLEHNNVQRKIFNFRSHGITAGLR